MQPPLLVLLLAFFLLPGAEAGEIIGGHEAKPHSRPYMAYLHVKREKGKSKCGGVLVGDNIVLTAAHCNGRSINVILGAHNIKKQEKTRQIIPVKRAIPHPDYNENKLTNDIMLLQLERNIKQTDAVKPLRLPRGNDLPSPGDNCTVAGWGRFSMNCSTSDTLQEGDSGGPFLCKNEIQGIVSYGNGCCWEPPKVYTKVASFLFWIKKTMKKFQL
ncbi:hypothetical protein QTO34_019395 [Cnephaeus nilssonii]|uniref:Peptidase S1 domain-containing protein n=1 Tax=Cnephaeus nilssonii TaxID=3371016 RepID=A0AA40HWU2_CNENI|nr:hypothetical protein QTO34_019395 [Eptesicus nilssonii]